MKTRNLGKTGINVSELCFGTLTLGPLQKKLDPKEAFPILKKAYDLGVNFYDTADMYNTYGHLRELIKVDRDIIVCTRSYDYSAEGVRKSLNRALRELGRDYVDLYLLHEQESRHTFRGHWDAIEELIKAKERGEVRAIGVSTHRVEAVRDSLDFPELEVIFGLINKDGLGIEDGGARQMELALKAARAAGKATMGMKPLGGGNLLRERDACLKYMRRLLDGGVLDTVAVGMQSADEVSYNVAWANGEKPDAALAKRLLEQPRELHVDDWCEGCGSCARKCHQNAISLVGGKATVDRSRCLTCGYCASVCPVFAIKIV